MVTPPSSPSAILALLKLPTPTILTPKPTTFPVRSPVTSPTKSPVNPPVAVIAPEMLISVGVISPKKVTTPDVAVMIPAPI